MLTKFLCKVFKLIVRQDLIDILCKTLYNIAMSKEILKKKYNTNKITEWTYYKKLWQLLGRLSMLEDIINKLR